MQNLVGVLIVASFGLIGCGSNPAVRSHGKPISYWVEKLQDADSKTRLKAVKALANVGAKDLVVVPALTAAVKDKNDEVRVESILALLRIGSHARDAIPALMEARQDSNAKVRECAVKALEKIQRSS